MTADADMSKLLVTGASAFGSPGTSRARMTVAVTVAVVAHAGLLAAALVTLDRSLGGGGGRIDAVEVELTDSSVLDNRSPTPGATETARASEHLADSIGNAAEDAATQPPSPPPPSARPVPPAEPESVAVSLAEPAAEVSTDVDPPATVVATATDAEHAPQIATTAGGETASGTSTLHLATSALAAAAPGAKAAYRQSVIAALAKSQPRGQGRAGSVRVVFTISPEGAIAAIDVAQSSGSQDLDRLAVEAVRRARFGPLPAGLTTADATFANRYTFR